MTMRYLALATDFDGTIAHDSRVEDTTLDALIRIRSSGRRVLLVTGRELTELLQIFPHCDVFDRVVAENGAMLYNPATKSSRVISPPPPPAFVDRLTREGVPISVGNSIVATVRPYEHVVLAAIRDLAIEWHVIFNNEAVMVLPAGITKATGLIPALAELDVPAERTIGIGDAENDFAFLRACGFGVAVANALPSLMAVSDLVTTGVRGEGVVELIGRILRDDLAGYTPRPENHQSVVVPTV